MVYKNKLRWIYFQVLEKPQRSFQAFSLIWSVYVIYEAASYS